jgi:hypothetical protein
LKNCSWWVYTFYFNNGTQVPSVSAKIKFDQNNEKRGEKKKEPIMYDGNGMSAILAFCRLIIIAIDYSQRLCLIVVLWPYTLCNLTWMEINKFEKHCNITRGWFQLV